MPTLDEKRTLIDVLSIKESVAIDGLKWVPTTWMRADPLTKLDPQLISQMLDFMADPTIALSAPVGDLVARLVREHADEIE